MVFRLINKFLYESIKKYICQCHCCGGWRLIKDKMMECSWYNRIVQKLIKEIKKDPYIEHSSDINQLSIGKHISKRVYKIFIPKRIINISKINFFF